MWVASCVKPCHGCRSGYGVCGSSEVWVVVQLFGTSLTDDGKIGAQWLDTLEDRYAGGFNVIQEDGAVHSKPIKVKHEGGLWRSECLRFRWLDRIWIRECQYGRFGAIYPGGRTIGGFRG
jgi:hypothetical protein